MKNLETKIFYRVRPEHYGFAPEDFDDLEEAVERINFRNSIRPNDHGGFYKGDNCVLQKVEQTITLIST